MTGGRETTANDLARRVVLVVLGLTFFALAALMWPSQASAQLQCESPGCRPLCVAGADPDPIPDTPLYALTTTSIGTGGGTFAVDAENPYEGASYNTNKGTRQCATQRPGEDVWDVKHWCTFHCEHRHYFVTPGGLPQPATAWITAAADSSSHFLGWTTLAEGCVPPASLKYGRLDCVQKMDQHRTVTAEFGTAEDLIPPDPAPAIERTATQRNTVTFAITTPSDDDTWFGGYEVYVNNVLRTRVRPDATTFTIANLLCNTDYTFRIDAFDSRNATPSNQVDATTNSCPKVAPNAVFHLKPPRRTKKKSAFFHWGARRGGVDLPQESFKSRCKVDKRRWAKCSAVSGKTVRKLKPGWHTFRVKVGDSQGWDRTPATWRWKVRR